MRTLKRLSFVVVGCAMCFTLAAAAEDRPNVVLADFESSTYGDWTVVGDAFGAAPSEGAERGQMAVLAYRGKRLANSFHNGDDTTGSIESPFFTINRKYLTFLVGGGFGTACRVELTIDGTVVRKYPETARPGGSEVVEPARFDVAEFAGKTARIRVVDEAKGSWGHILVDQIELADHAPSIVVNASRDITVEHPRLFIPVKNGAPMRRVTVLQNGVEVRSFDVEAADGDADWKAPLDVSQWMGQTLTIRIDKSNDDSRFLTAIDQADGLKDSADLYDEPLRPQFHFSPKYGWNNDPNGLVYYRGEYHMFFQYNPYGVKWGNMHWGHAISKDMIHWREEPIALYPDKLGAMFSGSAVVDWNATSGFGSSENPALMLVYTAASEKSVQCLASSVDGLHFNKYQNNPIVRTIGDGGDRDPKVFWHAPTRKWVMALYVGVPTPAKNDPSKKAITHTIHFLTSTNLKDWTITGRTEGFFECPDMFPLAVDGDPKNVKWVLTAADSDYMLGGFDGSTFTPETPKLKGHRGRGFYAAQTFSDIPASDGRRIMIGWFQTQSPGMNFNQSMTVPLDLKLIGTREGPRLSYTPAREIEALRVKSSRYDSFMLKPGDLNPTDGFRGELIDARIEFEPFEAAEVDLKVRGVSIRYDVKKERLWVNEVDAPAPLRGGRQRLIVLADRNGVEIFASDGLCYVPLATAPKADDRTVSLGVVGGTAKIVSARIHELKSIWPKK